MSKGGFEIIVFNEMPPEWWHSCDGLKCEVILLYWAEKLGCEIFRYTTVSCFIWRQLSNVKYIYQSRQGDRSRYSQILMVPKPEDFFYVISHVCR